MNKTSSTSLADTLDSEALRNQAIGRAQAWAEADALYGAKLKKYDKWLEILAEKTGIELDRSV